MNIIFLNHIYFAIGITKFHVTCGHILRLYTVVVLSTSSMWPKWHNVLALSTQLAHTFTTLNNG